MSAVCTELNVHIRTLDDAMETQVNKKARQKLSWEKKHYYTWKQYAFKWHMQCILYREAIRNQDKMPNQHNEDQDGHKLIISNRQK